MRKARRTQKRDGPSVRSRASSRRPVIKNPDRTKKRSTPAHPAADASWKARAPHEAPRPRPQWCTSTMRQARPRTPSRTGERRPRRSCRAGVDSSLNWRTGAFQVDRCSRRVRRIAGGLGVSVHVATMRMHLAGPDWSRLDDDCLTPGKGDHGDVAAREIVVECATDLAIVIVVTDQNATDQEARVEELERIACALLHVEIDVHERESIVSQLRCRV